MLYLVTYDLNRAGQDYNTLYNRIKAQGVALHALQNLWIVDSQKGLDEISNSIQEVLDSNDNLFVCPFNRYAGYLPRDVISWIDSRI